MLHWSEEHLPDPVIPCMTTQQGHLNLLVSAGGGTLLQVPQRCARSAASSVAAATAVANQESHEPHRDVLALEFPCPFSGYFHFIICKSSLWFFPCWRERLSMEEREISPHFSLLDPRPYLGAS